MPISYLVVCPTSVQIKLCRTVQTTETARRDSASVCSIYDFISFSIVRHSKNAHAQLLKFDWLISIRLTGVL